MPVRPKPYGFGYSRASERSAEDNGARMRRVLDRIRSHDAGLDRAILAARQSSAAACGFGEPGA